tara:strand:+ start:127 stop:492 length:366 start_codon:yes stop_codon:yes gene_type:complete
MHPCGFRHEQHTSQNAKTPNNEHRKRSVRLRNRALTCHDRGERVHFVDLAVTKNTSVPALHRGVIMTTLTTTTKTQTSKFTSTTGSTTTFVVYSQPSFDHNDLLPRLKKDGIDEKTSDGYK